MNKLAAKVFNLLLLLRTALAGCVFDSEGSEPTTVRCDLRILDFRRNSSEVTGMKSAERLRVHCSDVFFFESQLRSDHFGSLAHLADLSIDYCKIRLVFWTPHFG